MRVGGIRFVLAVLLVIAHESDGGTSVPRLNRSLCLSDFLSQSNGHDAHWHQENCCGFRGGNDADRATTKSPDINIAGAAVAIAAIAEVAIPRIERRSQTVQVRQELQVDEERVGLVAVLIREPHVLRVGAARDTIVQERGWPKDRGGSRSQRDADLGKTAGAIKRERARGDAAVLEADVADGKRGVSKRAGRKAETEEKC